MELVQTHPRPPRATAASVRVLALLLLLCAPSACSFDQSGVPDSPEDAMTPPPIDAPMMEVDAAVPVPDAAVPPEAFRRPITLRAPAAVSADVENFPAAVIIQNDAHLRDNAQTDGDDLVFVASDGETILDYEIESYDGSSGTLVAWVRIPLLRASGVTSLYLYYGDSDARSQQNANGTWTDDAVAVWHMVGIDEGERETEYRNSAGVFFDGQAQETQRPTVAQGIAGEAVNLDGVDDSILIDHSDGSDGTDLDPGDGSFSISMWLYVTATQGDSDQPWSKGNSSSDDPGISFRLGSGNWVVRYADINGDTNTSLTFGSVSQFRDEWVHLVMVLDRSAGENNLRGYINGAPLAAPPIDVTDIAAITSNEPARIGDTNNRFKGAIDEMRVYQTPLSADFIAAEYANLTDLAFVTIAAAEAAGYVEP